jgi:hypothetical protein
MLATSRVIGHKEWAPGRKSDPRYDMNMRRAQVAAFTPAEDDMPLTENDVALEWYGVKFRGDLNYAQVIHGIDDGVHAIVQQVTGLTAAVATLSEAVANGRDDLTAEQLRSAVSQAILDAGQALRSAQSAT